MAISASLPIVDLHRGSLENQFSVLPSDPLLMDSSKYLFITEIEAPGAFTIEYKNIKEGTPYTRGGNGNTQFYNPIVSRHSPVLTGITRISGFYLKVPG